MLPPDFDTRLRAELLKPYQSTTYALDEAIAYVLSGPGKLFRPKLVYASALTVSADPWQCALEAMRAIEMVHCYSLVHDDLPAMDDDDFRRGRPSCHRQFDEATAILVGDALIADAFSTLASSKENALAQVAELASAIGGRGIALGQHYDLKARSTEPAQWLKIHALKTGRLFEAACVMGALSANASLEVQNALREFATHFGLGFQLADDFKDNDGMVLLIGQDEVAKMAQESFAKAVEISRALGNESLEALCEQCRSKP